MTSSAVSIAPSGEHAQPRRDRLADHCDVIQAPRSAHEWILDSFRDQIRPIEGARDAALLRDALARIIRSNEGVALVAVPRGYGGDFVGWLVSLASLPQAALYIYVRRRFRLAHLGTLLLRARALSGTVGLAYSTGDAVAAQTAGMPVEHSILAYRALLSFTRRGI